MGIKRVKIVLRQAVIAIVRQKWSFSMHDIWKNCSESGSCRIEKVGIMLITE